MSYAQLKLAFYSLCLICSFTFLTIFIILLVYYCSKAVEANTLTMSQIHILIFSIIYAICNLSGIIYLLYPNSYSFIVSCFIQSFFRLIAQIGIQSSELSILIFTFISFKFSTFTNNHLKLLKLIILLIIWIPIFKDTLPELIAFFLGKISISYNSGGMCFTNTYKINQLVTCLILMILYISFLSSLHCLIWNYFKKNQLENSYQQYRSKLIIFYVSSIFTFPQILILIFNLFLSANYRDKIQYEVYIGLYGLYYITYNIFLMISSLIYCINKKALIIIKNKCCCKKTIPTREETLIQISFLARTTTNF